MDIRKHVRKIITRGVIDMATSAIIEEESFSYAGPIALCDGADALRTAVKSALEEHGKEIKTLITKFEADLKQYGSVQDGTKDAIAKLNTTGAELVVQYQALIEEKKALGLRLLDLEQKILVRGVGGQPARPLTIGEQYIASDEWKEFAARGRSAKSVSKPFHAKNITSITSSAGGGVIPEYLPTPVIPPFQPLTVRDLLDQGTTESNLIEWVKELVFTNSADVVSEGVLKAQSEITYERLNVPVTTIAHYFRASKQILADFKQLATLINNRATFGLKQEEEKQLLFGDGTGENLQGIVPQATAYSYAGPTTNDSEIDVIRHAMLQVQQAYYPTTGIVMSPADWHNLTLTKDTLHRYLYANPGSMTPAMLWGVPVVECSTSSRATSW